MISKNDCEIDNRSNEPVISPPGMNTKKLWEFDHLLKLSCRPYQHVRIKEIVMAREQVQLPFSKHTSSTSIYYLLLY